MVEDLQSWFDDRSEPVQRIIEFAGDLLWILLISFVLLWLSGFVRKRMRLMVERRQLDDSVAAIIDNVVRIGTYLLIAFLAFGSLMGDTGSTVTALGLVAAAISLSLQDVLRNFVSGIYLLIERPFKRGDTIRVADQTGEVERIDVRTTVIRNSRLEEVFIPNFKVFSEVVRRRSATTLCQFTVTVPGPLSGSLLALQEAAEAVQQPAYPPPAVKVTAMEGETVTFAVSLWETVGVDISEPFLRAVEDRLPEAKVTLVDA